MRNVRITFLTFAVTVLCLFCLGFAVDNEVAQPEGEMTEEIYVDITAHSMLYTAYFNKLQEEEQLGVNEALIQLSEKMSAIYEKHGVTESAYDDYAEQIMEDPQNYLEILPKINKRVEELVEEM